MQDINQGRILVLEELFIKTKIIFVMAGLFFVNYLDDTQIDESSYFKKVLIFTLIVYFIEGVIYIYQTQIKSIPEKFQPHFITILTDASLVSLMFFTAIEMQINLYPLFIIYVVVETLRFPKIHSAVFAFVASILYAGIVLLTSGIEAVLQGDILINITFLYFFALVIAAVIRDINSLVQQISFVQQELEEKNNYLKDISQQDQMTGLLNHQAFFETLSQLRKRKSRDQQNFCLALLDIDNFKKINDTYGHLAGDYILTGVAEVIKNIIRKTDLAARYGGEEFAVVMTDTNLQEGVKICERIRKEIAERPFDIDGQTVFITISGGISTSNLFAGDEDCQFVGAVDSLLYHAKRTGKNKIVAEMSQV